ncbi:MAG: protein kinase [Lysobacteraceae bacterium]
MIEIPGYRLLRLLGEGGMARVFLAVQQSLDREVALKILSPKLADDVDASARFLREARLAAQLHHPNIVPIHDVGLHDGVAYIAMQFEPGGTVAPDVGQPCDAVTALRIVRDIAIALDYAHGQGVVHRDIKPENILRRADGSCVLSDFGIARVIESQTVLTQEGTSIGTPQYMSPEQLRGEKVDGRADLYSLGVVLYQLLTGALPYTGSDGWAIGMQHINAAIPRLPTHLANMQPLLDTLMAKTVDGRPQTGAQVVRQIDLLLAATGTVATTPLPSVALVPSPRVASKAMVIGVISLLLAITAIAMWQFLPSHVGTTQAVVAHPVAGTPSVSLPAPSIAVLPFEDMSEAHDQGYFSDGIAEELLNLLAQVPGLRVAGRTSVLSFKGTHATAQEIGKALKVTTVLEGGVRKLGDRLRVTVRLVNVGDGFQLWSQSYDRKLTDVFAVQDDIAGSVVDALKIKLLPGDRPSTAKHFVPGVAAYDLFLRGRELLQSSRPEDYSKAVLVFRQVIALDPNYAAGHALLGMAESFAVEDNPDAAARAQGEARAMAAAEKAVALDPQLGDAYATRGYLRGTNAWDWDGALADLSEAVRLDPGVAANQLRYGYLLATLGRLPEASAALQRSTELEPLFTPAWYFLGRVKAAQSDYDGAQAALERTLTIDPGYRPASSYLGTVSLLRGNAAAAREIFLKMHDPAGIAIAEHDLGHSVESRQALDQVIAAQPNGRPYQIAVVYAWTGNRDQAFAWLDKAVLQHEGAIFLKYDPLLRGLRDDPRYMTLLRRLKLSE